MQDLKVTRSRVAQGTLSPASDLSPANSAAPAAHVNSVNMQVATPVVVPAGTRGPAKIDPKKGLHALRTEMFDVLHQVADHFRLRYGPTEWKKTKYGWSADASEATSKKAIVELTNKPGLSRDQMVTGFQGILRDFVHSTHDYHVSIAFTRLAQARLGFHVQPAADGRMFITGIDRRVLSKAAFPFEKGDELTSIDGRPVAELVNELKAFDTSSNAKTDLSNAASRLTSRRARVGEALPEKPTALLGITRKDGKASTFEVAWNTKAENVVFQSPGSSALEVRAAKADKIGPDMSVPQYVDSAEVAQADENGDGFVIGARKSFVPDLGPVIAREPATSPFDAYIYRAPNGKNIGVIRIPEYGPDKAADYAKVFADLVGRYEDATDALVIDQNNNPGGYFFYMMALLSNLSPNAMKMTGQQEAITPQEVYDAQVELQTYAGITDDKSAQKKLGKTVVGMPVTYDFVVKARQYNQHIIDEWNAGKKLTDSFPLQGLDYNNPSAKPYTKPILCLVNGNCYSCGDFFPAALQTNKRAVIFGEQTAGAGGYVLTHRFVNGLGVESLRTTGSVADRGTRNADGSISDDPRKVENPIENNAVVPDVPYEVTAADMQNGFTGYRDAVNAQILKMTA